MAGLTETGLHQIVSGRFLAEQLVQFLLSEHETLHRTRFAARGVALDYHGAKTRVAFSCFKLARQAREKPLQYEFFLDAYHAVVRSCHADIGLVSGAHGKNASVSRGDVSMGSQHSSNATVEVPSQRHLLRSRLSVHVYNDYLGIDL